MTDCELHPGRMQEVCGDRVCPGCYHDMLLNTKQQPFVWKEIDMSKGLTGRNEHYVPPTVRVGLKQW